FVRFPCVHAAANTPAERLNVSLRSFHPDVSVFPIGLSGRPAHCPDCSAFTRVGACTLALSPIRDTLIESFSHFVTSMTVPIASGGERLSGGICTHWKVPPLHGERQKQTSVDRLRSWNAAGSR